MTNHHLKAPITALKIPIDQIKKKPKEQNRLEVLIKALQMAIDQGKKNLKVQNHQEAHIKAPKIKIVQMKKTPSKAQAQKIQKYLQFQSLKILSRQGTAPKNLT